VLAKVVHISTVHSPHDPRIYYKQCRTLAQAGFDTTLIIPEGEASLPQDDAGVKILPLPRTFSRWQRLELQPRILREAKALEADIYHFHDPELLLLGRQLKHRNNIVIYDIHEDYETAMAQKQYIPKLLVPGMALAYRFTTKLLTRKMELCLAEKYYKEKFPRGRCILNYTLLSGRVPPPGSPIPRLLYTGNVTPERGALIHATLPQLNPAVGVDFIGRCSQEVADKIYQQAGEARNRISITGIQRYIPWKKVEAATISRRWLAGLALFPPSAHYRRKELTKFFEYMYAEIPILCSDFPQWRALVEHYDCGLVVDPTDYQAMAAALQYLLDNPHRGLEMGRNGRRAIEQDLNWEAQGRELVAWYTELLNRTRPAPSTH